MSHARQEMSVLGRQGAWWLRAHRLIRREDRRTTAVNAFAAQGLAFVVSE
jgi:hypothetical protein